MNMIFVAPKNASRKEQNIVVEDVNWIKSKLGINVVILMRLLLRDTVMTGNM